MRLKKIVLLGSMLTTLTLSTLATALPDLTLTTKNNTSLPSTVRITSSKAQPCSGSPPFYKITPSKGQLTIKQTDVNAICLGTLDHTKCTANLYASDRCLGNVIASLSINQYTLAVTIIKQPINPYHIDINNSPNGSVVTISQS